MGKIADAFRGVALPEQKRIQVLNLDREHEELISEVQVLKSENQTLKAKNKNLRAQMEALKKTIERLEQRS